MNKTEYLLTCIAEEGSEIAQRACKALRFGLSEVEPGQPDDNRRRLERELADLVATAELMGLVIHDEDKVAKRKKLEKYMAYSREIGTLDGCDGDCNQPKCAHNKPVEQASHFDTNGKCTKAGCHCT